MTKIQPTTTEYAAPAEFLASEHYAVLKGGITIDYSTVSTASDGSRVLPAGTQMAKVTEGGKFGPYDKDGSGGLEVGLGLLMYEVDCTEGDEMGGLLIHGIVKEAALPEVVPDEFKDDVPLIGYC